MIVRSLVVHALLWWSASSLAGACARAPAPVSTQGHTPEVSSHATAAAPSSPVAPPASDAVGSTAALADASGSGARATSGEPAAPADAPLEGEDFAAQARTLFRVAACGPGDDLPARLDAAVVGRHCDELGRAYRDYEKAWVDVARPFIAALRPRDLPRVVVYPFGGGDLTSALATFPDAIEITTISLEPAGDVRPVDTLPPERLARELAEHRSHLERLFEKAHSRTDNLEKESKTELPGEIVFALAALAVHREEPVSLRYFHLRQDGSVAYVTRGDVEAARSPADRRALFANAELRFRGAGVIDAPVQVLRHISFNLDDTHLRGDRGLLAYLGARPAGPGGQVKVAAMTKAASHLLWNDQFSLIRGWLLGHTDWMVSDSTGIPPRFAAAAGFLQDTYGTFNGPAPFGLLNPRDADDLRKLFASQPARDLAFRYGYPDKDGHGHLLVTRRTPVATDVTDAAP